MKTRLKQKRDETPNVGKPMRLDYASRGWKVARDIAGRIPVHGFFRAPIKGISMEPVWKDGTIVEFMAVREGVDLLCIERDYFVIRADGKGTFKRLHCITDDAFVFRALNRNAYPELVKVPKRELAFLAVAVAHVELVDVPNGVIVRTK